MDGWRCLKVLLMTAVAHAVAIASASATDYFVDLAGNNAAAGTALAPWRTLQFAANQVGPGDRVTVRPGSYAGFQLEASGTLAAPIEFFAQPGVSITQPVPVRGDGINLEGASHIIINGFNVAGMPHAGVRSVGFSDDFASNVTIRNVTATNNGVWGIFTGHVDDVLIENNRTSGSVDEHGIYVSNSGDRPIIRNNIIWGNFGSGIHMNGDLSQGGDGIISGALVESNIIYDNGLNGSGINMDCVQDSRIENNLIYNNHSSGISLYRIDGAEGSTGNVVVNNTIQQASNGKWALNIQDGSTDNTALNNILISNHSFRGAIDISADSRSGFTSDYNAVISRFTIDGGDNVLTLDQWRALLGNENNDDHSFVATAAQLFQNAAAGDYHLLESSPTTNTGTAMLAPRVDLDGKPRPIGAKIDVGAYEFGLAPLAGDYNQNGTVDAADYTLWRNGLGSIYSIDDYAIWKTNFGQSSGSGSAAQAAGSTSTVVPEPATALLLAFGLFVAPILLCCRGPLLNNCQRQRQICCYLEGARLQSRP